MKMGEVLCQYLVHIKYLTNFKHHTADFESLIIGKLLYFLDFKTSLIVTCNLDLVIGFQGGKQIIFGKSVLNSRKYSIQNKHIMPNAYMNLEILTNNMNISIMYKMQAVKGGGMTSFVIFGTFIASHPPLT